MSGAVKVARVAFQGEPGAYSDEATRAWFRDEVEPDPRRTFGEVVRAVTEGETEFGLLPIENSLAGSVDAALDALIDSDLEVVAETVLPIRHCLLATADATAEGIRRVLSHPVALAQCQGFFEERPDVEPVSVHDTAGAARLIREEDDPTQAALASAAAAERYGLRILRRDLQDRPDNRTRFLVVRRAGSTPPVDPGASPKTLVVFETEDRPGALVDVLSSFSERDINLTRLESRPGERPFTYRFIAEVAADLGRPPGSEALREARESCLSLDLKGPFRGLDSAGPTGAPGDEG